MRIVSCDATTLTAMQGCHEYWNLRFLQNWQPNHKAEPLEKGDLAHKMLEHYYKGLKFCQETGIEIDRIRLINESIEIGRTAASSMEIPIDEAERIVQIVIKYLHYPEYVNNDDFKILAVEQPFSYILHQDKDVTIVMEGVIDLLYESKLTNRTIMDHKTMSREYTMQHRSNQFINYANAFNTNWVIANKIGLQKTKPDADRFKRQVMSIPEALKEEWKNQAIETILEGIDAVDKGKFRKKMRFCTDFGQQCDYTPVCDAPDESIRTHKLMHFFYKGRPWSPYTK